MPAALTPEETSAAPVVASSASSQAATIVAPEQISQHDDGARRHNWDEWSFKHAPDSHLRPNYPGHYPPAVYFTQRSPSRWSHDEVSAAESAYLDYDARRDPSLQHDTGAWRYGTAADWLRCVNGSSGRTAHIKGIVCVVLAVVLILIVVLVLRYVAAISSSHLIYAAERADVSSSLLPKKRS
jgi:hypothetical protein